MTESRVRGLLVRASSLCPVERSSIRDVGGRAYRIEGSPIACARATACVRLETVNFPRTLLT